MCAATGPLMFLMLRIQNEYKKCIYERKRVFLEHFSHNSGSAIDIHIISCVITHSFCII
jgi:hypothetical protein